MIQHIGEDFSNQNKVKLNLIPGIKAPRGYFSVNLQWTSIINGHTLNHTLNHTSYNTFGEEFDIYVGSDVYELEYTINRHNSFPSGQIFHVKNRCRIDQLMFMNIVCKLLKHPKP